MTQITAKRLAELEGLLKQAIEIVKEERQIAFDTNKVLGQVYDPRTLRLLAKYDRWLKRARRQVE